MFKPFYTLAFFAVLVLFTSCDNTNNRTPEETTQLFLSLMADKDFKGAKTYASRETDQALDAIGQLQGIFSNLKQQPGQNLITKDLDLTEDITYTCIEEGNKASCECCEKATKACTTIKLLTENGQWVVHQPKETEIN